MAAKTSSSDGGGASNGAHAGPETGSNAASRNTHLSGTGRGAPLTDRVNVEPPILRGITSTEAQVIGILSLVACVAAGLLVYAITGFWQLILLFSIFGPLMTVWISAGYLATIKRGRPDGYYGQAMRLWAIRHGLMRPRFTLHDGGWGLGRSLGMPLCPEVDYFGQPPFWLRLAEDLSPTAFLELLVGPRRPLPSGDHVAADNRTSADPTSAGSNPSPTCTAAP